MKNFMTIKRFMTIVYIICLSVIMTPVCYAYIDPATTSYLIQIIAGVVIALGTVVGIYWNKLKRLFKKKKGDAEEASVEMIKDRSEEKNTVTAEDLLDD